VESSSPSHFSQGELEKIFSFESPSSVRLNSRENGRLEFKEQFNLGSVDEYAKTGAAFANAQGGYIVFGVKDAPRELVGLKSEHFNTFDSAKLTNGVSAGVKIDHIAPRKRRVVAV
jgi:predicted HTH transcriptional regulator